MALVWQTEQNGKIFSPATSFTVVRPASVVDGEILIAIAGHHNATSDLSISGVWTPLMDVKTGTASTDLRARLFYRIAASEPTSYTVSLTVADICECAIWRVSGEGTVRPIGATSSNVGTGTSMTCPAITALQANSLIGSFFITNNTSASLISVPTGYTQRESPSSSSGCWTLQTKAQVAAGDTGSTSSTVSDGATGDLWVAGLFEIMLPGVSPPPPNKPYMPFLVR